jgi:hypothetical protein
MDDCASLSSLAATQGAYTPGAQIANAMVHGRALMRDCLQRKGWRPATAEEIQAMQATQPK